MKNLGVSQTFRYTLKMTMMELKKQFNFDAAHSLPKVPEGHKCKRLHGHGFKMTLTVKGPLDPHHGWVMDFGEISSKAKHIINELDHHYLNEIPGLENPTSENLCIWIWKKLKPELPLLSSIEINETCTSSCIYSGE